MPIFDIYSEATKTEYLEVRQQHVSSSEVCTLLKML